MADRSRALVSLVLAMSAAAPAFAQESPALRAPTIHFATSVPGVRVHYVADPTLEDDGQGGLRVRAMAPNRYTLLCEAPCERELPRTHYALAFARGASFVRPAEPFGIDGPTRVEVTWHDRAVLRDAAVVLMSIGIPAGVLLAMLPIAIDRASGGESDETLVALGAGTGVFAASLVVGILLAVQDDGAALSVAPLSDTSGVFSDAWHD